MGTAVRTWSGPSCVAHAKRACECARPYDSPSAAGGAAVDVPSRECGEAGYIRMRHAISDLAAGGAEVEVRRERRPEIGVRDAAAARREVLGRGSRRW